MQLLIENGFGGHAEILRIVLNEAVKVGRTQALRC